LQVKTTLETGVEDVKTTLGTSVEDVKTTLKTRKKNRCTTVFQNAFENERQARAEKESQVEFHTENECIFMSSPTISSVVLRLLSDWLTWNSRPKVAWSMKG
jgi:hypothetical protein